MSSPQRLCRHSESARLNNASVLKHPCNEMALNESNIENIYAEKQMEPPVPRKNSGELNTTPANQFGITDVCMAAGKENV